VLSYVARSERALPDPCCDRSPQIRYQKAPPEPPRADGLSLGAKITHPTFGFGHITNLDEERITILFDKSGSKKIAADYIKLA